MAVRWMSVLATSATLAAAVNDWENYQSWLAHKKGYAFSTVSILDDGKGMRRMVATQDIEENFLIAKMPQDSIFSPKTADMMLDSLDCKDLKVEDMDGRTKLTVSLLMQNTVPNSQWRPYLDTIPWEKDFPVAWGPSDLALLRGSSLQLEVIKERGIHEREYNGIIQNCSAFGEKFTMDQFLRVGGLVGSQASGEDVLLPFMDLANHDNNPNAELGLAQDMGVYALVSTRLIREGEEVTVSYYQDEPADMTSVSRYGFLDDNPIALCTIVAPACIPPSLNEIAYDRQQEDKSLFEGFSPELTACCDESVDNEDVSDRHCYALRLNDPDPMKTFTFPVGPVKDGMLGEQNEDNAYAFLEFLHRQRQLVADSGLVINKKCNAPKLDLLMPINIVAEREMLRVLKDLLGAHLDGSAWAVGQDKPPSPADSASDENVRLARRAMRVERTVLEWYSAAVDFADEYLNLGSTDALRHRLCAAFAESKKKKGSPDDFKKYNWMVENILAPLAFEGIEQNGEMCSVKSGKHKMEAKDCKGILKGHDEL